METVKPMEQYADEIMVAVQAGDLDTVHNLILGQCAVHGMHPQMSIMALQRRLIDDVQEMTVNLLAMQCELDEKNKRDMI